jgi:hypothetical protein
MARGEEWKRGKCRLESLGSGCNVGSRQSVIHASGQLEGVLGACTIVWYGSSIIIIIIWTHAYGSMMLGLQFSSQTALEYYST